MDDLPPSGRPATNPAARLRGPRVAIARRWSSWRQPYSDRVQKRAAFAGVVLLGLAGVVILLATPGPADDWTRFDGFIECDSSWLSVIFIVSGVMFYVGVAVVVVGLVRAIRSRSWASTLVSFSGLCLLVCCAACGYLAIQVSYAGMCD